MIYAESSAVLAWLLGETRGEVVRQVLAGAEVVFASELTLVECRRALHRAVALAAMPEADGAALGARLAEAARHWVLLALDAPVLERAGRPFPVEPIRPLDALHLASALVARGAVPDVALLTLDERVRLNGAQLGFSVVPP